MFEDFSFSSPSSNGPICLARDADDRAMPDCDCTMVSPLSSRCPSPSSSLRSRAKSHSGSHPSWVRRRQAPTSIPTSYEPQHRLSIGRLTEKLYAHTLGTGSIDGHTSAAPLSSGKFSLPSTKVPPSMRGPRHLLTPPDTDQDDDGYYDFSPLHSPRLKSDCCFFGPTSVPSFLFPPLNSDAGSLDNVNGNIDDRGRIRLQRQHLSSLQCNAETGLEAAQMALLAEEKLWDVDVLDEDDCHPSCLPPSLSPKRRTSMLHHTYIRHSSGSREGSPPEGRARRKSASALLPSHRIEKPRYQCSGRDLGRDIHKKNEQGLRRRSLVSAALAKMTFESSSQDSKSN